MSIKTRRHLDGWCKAIIGAIAMWSVTWFVFSIGNHTFQSAMPVSFYFDYQQGNEVVPIRKTISHKSFASFHSNSIYHYAIRMRWEDTMYCTSNVDGLLHKKKTQVWEEYMVAGTTDPTETWQYREQPFDISDDRCHMKSVAIGTTSLGYRKVLKFSSAWIKITH